MPIQDDIAALNSAIAGGEKQVVISGESVTYRSIDELIAARSDLQRQLNSQTVAAATPLRRPSRRSVARYAGRQYNDHSGTFNGGFGNGNGCD